MIDAVDIEPQAPVEPFNEAAPTALADTADSKVENPAAEVECPEDAIDEANDMDTAEPEPEHDDEPADASGSAKKVTRARDRTKKPSGKRKLSAAEEARKRARMQRSKIEAVAPPVAPSPVAVRLSRVHRAKEIRLSADSLSATGFKGFTTVRSSHPVPAGSGDWYFEVRVDEPQSANAHVRVGWATAQANLHNPVGFDHCSYSYRDVDGTKFHQAIGRPYGDSFGVGDVVGCHLHLPTSSARTAESGVFHPGARISFFKNGVNQGVAFAPLLRGQYFPAVSLFMGARITVNFGPCAPISTSTVSEPASIAGAQLVQQSEQKGQDWWFPPDVSVRALAELPAAVDAIQNDDGSWITDR